MSHFAIQINRQIPVDVAVEKVTAAIKEVGFGILTRIDFDQKIKEKLNENIPRTVILGACNPRLALDAYKQNSDAALLVPCNIVITDKGNNSCLIEAMRPSKMLEMLSGISDIDSIMKAEKELERVLISC
jgi:uncharacterized protein (DUF302 family)